MPRRFRSESLPETVPHAKAAAFGRAMAWLARRGVPADRLASCFDTSGQNVRVQVYRARHAPAGSHWFAPVMPDLELPYGVGSHGEVLGLRPYDEFTAAPAGRDKPLERLEEEISQVVERHASHYLFLGGAKGLLDMRRSFGHTSDPKRLAVRALLHEKTAWFLVHSGFAISAVKDATWSLWLYQFAYNETQDRRHLGGYVRSALIASHANLLTRRPQAALNILDIAQAAAERSGHPIGSDHFRQRGVALFQLGQNDEQARVNFEKSSAAMVRLGEASSDAQVLMTGSRHTNLLGQPNWEQAQSVLEICGRTFAEDSLETSMNRHWASACALATDDKRIHLTAMKHLKANENIASRFGHQATIHKLLTITPELDLDTRLRRAWIRWLLYENLFSTH